jgi:hypothetical protein
MGDGLEICFIWSGSDYLEFISGLIEGFDDYVYLLAEGYQSPYEYEITRPLARQVRSCFVDRVCGKK